MNLSLSPVRKSAPRQGRRAVMSQDSNDNMDSPPLAGSPTKGRLDSADISLANDSGARQSRKSAPPRREGGWADENSRPPPMGDEVTLSNDRNLMKDDNSDEDVPVIPDLEEVEQETLATRVAEAPSVAVNRVATYKELDSDLFKHAAFSTLDDIDLRLLTRCMAPESAVKEADEPWNWDVLFTDVSSTLTAEWFPEADKDIGESKSSVKDRPYTAFNRFPV